MVSLYLFQTLYVWIKSKHEEGSQSFAQFLKKKNERYLLEFDILTSIIPYLFVKH